MTFYPEDSGPKLEEVWNGDKMVRDVPDHLLTPMFRHNGVIYYVNELVKLHHGVFFLPKRWITSNGVPSARGFCVIDSLVNALWNIFSVLI